MRAAFAFSILLRAAWAVEWDWNIAVIYKRNNAASTRAKEVIQAGLCSHFRISPCAVATTPQPRNAVYLAADLDVHVPAANFSDIVIWLMVHRSEKVNGVHDVDLLLAPDLEAGRWPAKGATDLAVYAGFPTPLNTNRFPAQAKALPVVIEATTCGNKCDVEDSGCEHSCDDLVHKMNLSCAEYYAPGKKYAGWCDETCGYGGCVDDAWATACSRGSPRLRESRKPDFKNHRSDATCYAPYVNNTGCTGPDGVKSLHFHFYYVPNSPGSLSRVNAFTEKATAGLNLAVDVCPDNDGHEQPHNATCWLTGPGGSGPLPPPPQWTQAHGTSSFTFSAFSLYVVRSDLARVLPYVMSNKPSDVDFLAHPNTGCSWPDHVEWGLHATAYTAANRYGVASEAGWYGAEAPPTDAASAANAATLLPADAAHNCSAVEAPYGGLELHLLYDPTPGTAGAGRAAKLAAGLAAEFAAAVAAKAVVVEAPALDAYADPHSPFLTAHTAVKVVPADPAVVAWALAAATAAPDVDLVLAPAGPSAHRDGACGPGDYVARSLYAGRRWRFNEAFTPPAGAPGAASPPAAVGADDVAVATNFALYFLAAPNNAYQRAALDAAAAEFEKRFPMKACGVAAPFLAPKRVSAHCALGTSAAPYETDGEAILVAYAAYQLDARAEDFAAVLSAIMALRAAGGNGHYDVDVLLAPLVYDEEGAYAGNATLAYGAGALKAGSDWRINPAAL